MDYHAIAFEDCKANILCYSYIFQLPLKRSKHHITISDAIYDRVYTISATIQENQKCK